MTAKEYVKNYFPDARCEYDGILSEYDIWSNNLDHLYIASEFTEEDAWEAAKTYIDTDINKPQQTK